MATLASGWPTETDTAARCDVTLTGTTGAYTVDSINVSDLLTRAYWHVAEYCHRDTHGTTELGFDEAGVTSETHDGGTIISVKHPPIVAVTSLYWDDSLLSGSTNDFYVYPTYIQIARDTEDAIGQRDPYAPYPFPRYVAVTYTGGFSNSATGTHVVIPHELREIVLEVAVRWFLRAHQQYRVDKNVASSSVGGVSAHYKGDLELLADLYARLDAMDRRVNVRDL
jgi:hypothetical protein